MKPERTSALSEDKANATWRRHLYAWAGWFFFVLGIIGIVVPLLPTTIFWIIAAWLWLRGAPHRLAHILEHPQLGPPVRDFLEDGVVSRRGKFAALIGISISYVIWQLLTSPGLEMSLGLAAMLSLVLVWLFMRPENTQSQD